eukprot:9483586-Pyramimonas_sp.AAC.2
MIRFMRAERRSFMRSVHCHFSTCWGGQGGWAQEAVGGPRLGPTRSLTSLIRPGPQPPPLPPDPIVPPLKTAWNANPIWRTDMLLNGDLSANPLAHAASTLQTAKWFVKSSLNLFKTAAREPSFRGSVNCRGYPSES